MSKKRIVEIIENAGANYGQISHPNDLALSQNYAHQHAENLTKDFMQSPTAAEVAECGFSFSGMDFAVNDGRIYYSGKQYDVAFTNNRLAAANGSNSRIDLVVATIADEVPINSQFVAFQRLRTAAELAANTQYPQTQFQRSTERQNLAVVSVKTGTPAANPVAPALGANEVALCRISIPAGGTQINVNWITDLRNKVTNLATLDDEVNVLQQQMVAALNYENQVRFFGSSFGRADTLNGLLIEIAQAISVLRFRYPTVASSNGRLPISTTQEGSKWVADIPIGNFVQFGDRYVSITPDAFVDKTLNPRYATSSNTNSVKYAYIFDNQSAIQNSAGNANAGANGNVVRFDVPAGTNGLYINRDGQITLSNVIQPSDGLKCLLAKLTTNTNSAPTIKSYYNSRNGVIIYTNTYNSADPKTKQFEWNSASPVGVGFFEAYAIRASDKIRYNFDDITILESDFDKTITLNGIQSGDKWVIIHTILSTI